jgi:glutamate dehydrogenase/leucine dehydrogenase
MNGALGTEFEHESLSIFHDPETGATGAIAIHSTALGPAMGGLRLNPYPTVDDAVLDALRLARAMSLKNAVAGLELGGGKAVVIDDGRWQGAERDRRMQAVGRAVEALAGRYVTAEDVGTTPADMDAIAGVTDHVAGRSEDNGGRGNPSPYTARTVFTAIESGVRARLGSHGLAGIRVGVQGAGQVGERLVGLLAAAGAIVSVADIDSERAMVVAAAHGAAVLPLTGFLERDFDVLSPCALGGAIDATMVPRLRALVIAGAANNPLAGADTAGALDARGILYVPDFIANCGGIIHVGAEALNLGTGRVEELLDAADLRTDAIIREAGEAGRSPLAVAEDLAGARMNEAAGPWSEVEKAVV